MTALVLENLAALPTYTKGLRMLLSRLARALDALVSARAARAVPEWRMREVQSEINRHLGYIRAGECGEKNRLNVPHEVLAPHPTEFSVHTLVKP
jgi:hypothetical protein